MRNFCFFQILVKNFHWAKMLNNRLTKKNLKATVKRRKYRISRHIRRTVIFSLEILEKKKDEYILILVIH